MRRYDSVAEAAIEYRRLVESLESPRSPSLWRSERCKSCGLGPLTIVGRRGREVIRCASCWTLWEGSLVEGPMPHRAGGEPSWPQMVMDLMRLRRVFEPRPRRMTLRDWRAHQLAYFGLLDPRLGSYASVARLLQGILPPRGASPRVARGMVARAEFIFSRRMGMGGSTSWRKPRG